MASSYHHGDLPAALLTAGHELVDEDGQDSLSMRELARRAGVSATAAYRHFTDRAAVLEALAVDGYRQAAEALGRHPRPGAKEVAAVWATLAEETPGLFALMASAGAAAPGTPLAEAVLEWLGEVTRAVERPSDRRDPAAAVRRAVSCWAAAHGVVSLRAGGALGAIDAWMLPDPAWLAEVAAEE